VESFGARLKREREQRGVTLDDIALSTKIGKRFLTALEEEHFEQLPASSVKVSCVPTPATWASTKNKPSPTT